MDMEKLDTIFKEMEYKLKVHVGGSKFVVISSTLKQGRDAIVNLFQSENTGGINRYRELKQLCEACKVRVGESIIREEASAYLGTDEEFVRDLPKLVSICAGKQRALDNLK